MALGVGRAGRAGEEREELVAHREEGDLFAADADHDVVSESSAGLSQSLHHAREIINLDGKPVPPAWLLLPTIGHRLPSPGRRIRGAENEAQIAARQHREGGRRVHMTSWKPSIWT